MKRALCVLFILIPFLVLSQEEENYGISLGGNIGLQFGDVTLIDVSPLMEYRFNEHFALGIGGTYKYYKIKSFFSGSDLKSHYYGGSVFARYYIGGDLVDFLENVFLHTEYEMLNYHYKVSVSDGYVDSTVESMFVGGGYRMSIGRNSFANILVLWNINDVVNSPYDNPLIRVGIMFGL
ncbi:MAG: hypothetical protein U9R32_10825 [Bacteroidota bacterium]|nr:hypothetical protein [Bacteroidota bacterium]